MTDSLIKTWRLVLDNLYEAAKDRIELELADGCGDYCDTSVIRSETEYIDNLNSLSSAIDDIEQGSLDYDDLGCYAEFIKKDEGDRDSFEEILEDYFEYETIDNIEDNIQSVLSTVFD